MSLFLLREAAYGAEKGTLELSPAFVDVVLSKPDEQKQIVLNLTNNSNKPVSLELYPIDFKQKDEFGTIGFLGQDAGSFSYSLSSFVSFESNRLDLDPHEKKKFTLVVKNREDLSPGGHYAAIVAKLVTSVKLKQGDGILSPAVSALILLRKTGGERFNLSLTSVDWPTRSIEFSYPSSLTLTFQNEGNVHVVPYGTVEIRDIFNRVAYKGIINTSSLRVLPESRRRVVVDISGVEWGLPISLNTIQIQGNDSLSKVFYTYNSTFFYINPYLLFAIFVGVIYIIQKKIRKKKK